MFVGLIQLIFQGFLDGSLSPSVTKLDELLNGNVSTITDWFTWLSGGLMGILFVYRLFTTYAYNTMGTEVKSSLRTLLIRTAFCACVLAFVMYFGDFVLDWGMRAYDKAIEYFGQQTAGNVDYGMLGNDSVQDAVMTLQEDFTATDITDEDPSSVTVFGLSIGNTLSGLFSGSLVTVILIALVIRIACLILCGYNLIKLIVELAQRYMMTMVLYMALPMSLPFYIAVETEQTFFTYQKMFASGSRGTCSDAGMDLYCFLHVFSPNIVIDRNFPVYFIRAYWMSYGTGIERHGIVNSKHGWFSF